MFFKFPKLAKWQGLKEVIEKDLYNQSIQVSIFEKLDGMHIGIYVPYEENESIEVYSRNGIEITDSEALSYLKSSLFTSLRNYINNRLPLFSQYKGMYFDGELCGLKIANRIDYGCKQAHVDNFVKLYTGGVVTKDNKLVGVLPCHAIVAKFETLDIYVLKPKKANIFYTTFKEEVLPTKTQFDTGSDVEGFVYYFTDFELGEVITMRKHKDKAFNDVKAPFSIPMNDNTKAVREVFRTYITENRALDVLSKHDLSIELKYEDSLFIKEVFNDAWMDFKEERKDLLKEMTTTEKRKLREPNAKLRDKLKAIFSNKQSKLTE